MRSPELTRGVVNAVKSRNPWVAAFAVVAIVVGFGVWWSSGGAPTTYESAQNDTLESVRGLALPAANPQRLRIPEVQIDAPFEWPLGVAADGEIEVPEGYETVGYYKFGPTPGELGPSVVLGHVDSVEGPAVFYRLGQLEVGAEIFIDREDGTTATFVVEAAERHVQSGFPTAKVYSDLDYAGLRLITCSGTFDRGEQRYSHNLIVFAKLAGTSTAAVE